MYKLLLILKYLRRKIAPMFAALAVTLCTAMVIIVISVMGGFLDMFRSAIRTLTSDITVQASVAGMPYYQELTDAIAQLPGVAAVTPTVGSFGLLRVGQETQTVEVVGIDPAGYDAVSQFRQSLYWSSAYFLNQLHRELARTPPQDAEQTQQLQQQLDFFQRRQVTDFSMQWKLPPGWDSLDGNLPGAVVGIEVSRMNLRAPDGNYYFEASPLARAQTRQLVLTVLPISERGVATQQQVSRLQLVNEFKSGLYDIDAHRVYVPFELLQKMLMMEPAAAHDWEGRPTGKMLPGRASQLLVRAAAAAPLERVRDDIQHAVAAFTSDHPDLPALSVMTWEQVHAPILGAVAKEKGMVTFLFAVVSVVAFAMIAVIFYMIVLEKTRDIGVLRALGAARPGIAGIFLGYGLAIGILGACLGAALAAAVVWNINEIQDWLATELGLGLFYAAAVLVGAFAWIIPAIPLAKVPAGPERSWAVGLLLLLVLLPLGFFVLVDASALETNAVRLTILLIFVVLVLATLFQWLQRRLPSHAAVLVCVIACLGALGFAGTAYSALRFNDWLAPLLNRSFSFRMWNPETYYFDRIPSRLKALDVTCITVGAIIASVLGALVPAIRASRLDPVEALRYE